MVFKEKDTGDGHSQPYEQKNQSYNNLCVMFSCIRTHTHSDMQLRPTDMNVCSMHCKTAKSPLNTLPFTILTVNDRE